MEKLKVKIKLIDGMMPKRATDYSAAYDLYCPKDMYLEGKRGLIPLGFCMQMPKTLCFGIQPRSGFSLKGFEADVVYYDQFGFIVHEVKNARIDADCAIGLVDSDYIKGEVGVIYKINDTSDIVKMAGKAKYEYFKIIVRKGARIAQGRFAFVPDTELEAADELDESTDRGGGYGHTGTL